MPSEGLPGEPGEPSSLEAAARRAALAPACAHGGAVGHARLKLAPEDFRVEEDLGYAADGGAAHLLLQVEKIGRDTPVVARELARAGGVDPRDVGYAGLKDRHAVTLQWFSVPAARAAAEWRDQAGEGWRVLEAAPHARKLRRGALRGNAFRIVLRELEVDDGALEFRLRAIAARGFPNYFGPQRFGREGSNVSAALSWAAGARLRRGRDPRSFVYSAARSIVFNAVADARVSAGSWDALLPGELVNLDGRRSWFRAAEIDDTLRERLAGGDVHPTGPLPGTGEAPDGEAGAVEAAAAAPFAALVQALETARVEAARRALRVRPVDFTWQREGATLTLGFRLPAGAYATALVRELVATDSIPEDADDA